MCCLEFPVRSCMRFCKGDLTAALHFDYQLPGGCCSFTRSRCISGSARCKYTQWILHAPWKRINRSGAPCLSPCGEGLGGTVLDGGCVCKFSFIEMRPMKYRGLWERAQHGYWLEQDPGHQLMYFGFKVAVSHSSAPAGCRVYGKKHSGGGGSGGSGGSGSGNGSSSSINSSSSGSVTFWNICQPPN